MGKLTEHIPKNAQIEPRERGVFSLCLVYYRKLIYDYVFVSDFSQRFTAVTITSHGLQQKKIMRHTGMAIHGSRPDFTFHVPRIFFLLKSRIFITLNKNCASRFSTICFV